MFDKADFGRRQCSKVERRREEAARERDRERREKATAKAQAALEGRARACEEDRGYSDRGRGSGKSARWPRTTDGKKKRSGCRLRSDGHGSRPARAHSLLQFPAEAGGD